MVFYLNKGTENYVVGQNIFFGLKYIYGDRFTATMFNTQQDMRHQKKWGRNNLGKLTD